MSRVREFKEVRELDFRDMMSAAEGICSVVVSKGLFSCSRGTTRSAVNRTGR